MACNEICPWFAFCGEVLIIGKDTQVDGRKKFIKLIHLSKKL